jgi:hypothetical protein
MSQETKERNVLEVLREAQISIGGSNPQLFFKSMIDNFNSDISDFGEDSNESAEFDWSQGPITHKRDRGIAGETLTASIENISVLLSDRVQIETGINAVKAEGRVRTTAAGTASHQTLYDDSGYSDDKDSDETPTLSLPDSFEAGIGLPGWVPGTAINSEATVTNNLGTANILERIKVLNQVRAQRDQTVTYLKSFKELENSLRAEIARLKLLVEDRNHIFQNLVSQS